MEWDTDNSSILVAGLGVLDALGHDFIYFVGDVS